MAGVDAAELSAMRRAEVATVLLEIVDRPHTTPAMVCVVAGTLDRIGHRSNPEIISALQVIVDDDTVDQDNRSDAAEALAQASDDHLATAAVVALRNQGTFLGSWTHRAMTLAALGADVVPHLTALLTDSNAACGWHIAAAATLYRLRPDLRTQFVAELRKHCDDENLRFTLRSFALLRLLQLDPSTHSEVVRFHQCALDDERQSVADRCEAAEQVAQLDASSVTKIMSTLQRFAIDSRFTASERWTGFHVKVTLRATWDSEENNRLGLMLAHDPAIPAFVRGKLPRWMSGRARLEVERSLLADRTTSPSERVGDLNTWEHYALGKQAEAVLRDILHAVESTQAERVAAAGALGNLAPLHVPEAVGLLNELATDKRVTTQALAKLADLSLSERRRIVAEAGVVVADETRSWRDRRDAAVLVCELASVPAKHIVEYLQTLVDHPQVADVERVRILYLIKEMDRLRSIRDKENAAPAVRWRAARRLREFDVADRAAGVRILNDIATDARPVLRWRAARDLTTFGERGRELGAAALEAIVLTETLPVAVRASAAETLADVRPDRRVDMMRSLRRLATDNPRTKLHILQAIGRFDPLEGALALSDMAVDTALSAGVRLRAAVAMAGIRRDFRDQAAVTAHEVAYDEACPWHIRLKAARQLARWSDPCRAQAQALIRRLAEGGQWTRSRPVGEPSSGTSAHWSAAST